MPISARQFDILNQMGINLWQAKAETDPAPANECVINIDQKTFESLLTSALFNDIVTAMGTSADQVHLSQNRLNIGVLTWQFHTKEKCEVSDQSITTPAIEVIKASPTLKRELWQQLQTILQ